MLTEICQFLHNWFNRDEYGGSLPTYSGEFSIVDGSLQLGALREGQYFRIIGSLLNDGIHHTSDALQDETFTGTVWSIRVPPSIIQLATEIEAWQAAYGGTSARSPYQSESFGGYSYSKTSGVAANGADASTWQGVFADRLEPWRKL